MGEVVPLETPAAPGRVDFRLPGPSHRLLVAGSTGAGKTQLGVFALSTRQQMNWHRMPVTIFDWKREKLLNSIGAREWDLRKEPPRQNGLYIVHPDPDDLADVDAYLLKVWRAGNHGLFFDEASELEKSKGVNRIMKQGRSLHIPCISCTQRPVWLPRSVFSEADFFAILRLNDRDDQTTIKRFVNADVYKRHGEYFSLWYDAGRDRAIVFSPVPEADALKARFRASKNPATKKGLL